METVGSPLLWSAFGVVVICALALDLFVFHREAHDVRFREAMWWTVFWIVLSLAFNAWIYFGYGSGPGLEFFTGYLIEKALSVDNIFVFIVLFGYFSVPGKYQHRVLFWGILGAVLTRGAFVVLGVALITTFRWVLHLFGAFLVFTGLRLMVNKEPEVHPERNPVLLLARRRLRVTSGYDDQSFVKRLGGQLYATPLLLVLLVVEATDVMFAVDSIPAVFGVTQDPFIVFTSNIFAVLGLRALYFVLHDLMSRFEYLHYGLGLVLAFIGVKMLLSELFHIPIRVSLGVVAGVLAVSVLVSWIRSRHAPGKPGPPMGSRARQ